MHGGEPYRVRSVWRAGGKYPDPCITAEARRAHRRTPTIPPELRKFPYNPEVRVALDAAQGVRVAELRLEYYPSDTVCEPALPRYAKPPAEVGMYFRYYLHVTFAFRKV